MKILVTGADGFIGSYLVPELQQAKHEVIPTVKKNGDLVLPSTMASLLSTHRPDVVVHLAAKTSRLLCEDDPRDTVFQNTVATLNVALACKQFGAKLVYASTSEVYGHQGDKPVDEDSPTYPTGIYALTKLWGEQVARLYAPNGLLILRISMPYGQFQSPAGFSPVGKGRAAIVNFLYNAYHRRPITVHAGTERSLCYVTDTVYAIRTLIEQEQEGIWNVGRDDATMTMERIAQIACELAAGPEKVFRNLIEIVPAPPRQVVVKRLSMQKLLTTGWRPTVDIDEGMQKVLEWVKTLPG